MNLIFASDLNGLIGLNGSMPWNQRVDLRRFSALTKFDHKGRMPCVFMGRKTYESLNGHDLPGRNKVIISSSFPQHFDEPGRELWMTVPEVLAFTKNKSSDVPFWVIGGAQVYSLLLPFVNTIYWTKLHTSVIVDCADEAAYWEVPLFEFTCVDQSEVRPPDEKNQFPYQFMKFKRMSS